MEAIIKRKLSVEEYHRMAEVDILDPDERIELIDGEIVQMSPIGNKHLGIVSRITALLIPRLLGKYTLHVQSPIKIDPYSEPEPDLMITPHRDDYYASTGVYPKDVLLLIEVADTTLRKDIQIKLPLYAQAAIPETWIIDLKNDIIHQYANLQGNQYQQQNSFTRNDKITATQLPLTVKGSELIGKA